MPEVLRLYPFEEATARLRKLSEFVDRREVWLAVAPAAWTGPAPEFLFNVDAYEIQSIYLKDGRWVYIGAEL